MNTDDTAFVDYQSFDVTPPRLDLSNFPMSGDRSKSHRLSTTGGAQRAKPEEQNPPPAFNMPFSPLRARAVDPAVVSNDTSQKRPPPVVHSGDHGAISIQIQN